MLITKIEQTVIVDEVMRAVRNATKCIYATMLLSQELQSPLPKTYHDLLGRKIKEGVKVYRVGFGARGEYNTFALSSKNLDSKSYSFRYLNKVSEYQRMLCIDEKKLFFGVDGSFFTSEYKPLVKVFMQYFNSQYNKAKI
ncbi:MAG: hypothetical protein RLZZ455_705 [Candidatus Parcubacteria bacterium]|jgi:hypothetical protein